MAQPQDAAVGTALMAAFTLPTMTGLAGGGIMTVCFDGEVHVLVTVDKLTLGFDVPDPSDAQATLERARSFQDALWRLYAHPPRDVSAVPSETIFCRCEEVTKGELDAAKAERNRAKAFYDRVAEAARSGAVSRQELTDAHVKEIDETTAQKEEEILQV